MLAVLLGLAFASVGSAAPSLAVGPVQSTLSAFLSCSAGVSFAAPATASSCASGTYTGAYTGVDEVVGTTQNSLFYLAFANGGVKITFSLTDATTGALLFSGVGYGSISGGTCASPSIIVPASSTSSASTITSGDTLKMVLNTTFTGTGTPTFCAGGSSATLISVGTTVVTASAQPTLTTMLTAGKAHQTTLFGFSGVAESYVDTGSAPLTAIVLGMVKNSAGATVAVMTTSDSFSTTGSNATAFLAFPPGVQPGTYSVVVVAVTGSNVPVSSAVMLTVLV